MGKEKTKEIKPTLEEEVIEGKEGEEQRNEKHKILRKTGIIWYFRQKKKRMNNQEDKGRLENKKANQTKKEMEEKKKSHRVEPTKAKKKG